MNRIHSWLRFYFGLTRTEAKGFFVLFILIFIFLVSPFFFGYLIPRQPFESTVEDKRNLEILEKAFQANIRATDFTPFAFDPNQASEAELASLGIPDNIVRRIINYRSKGGKFKTKEDLKKIYQFPAATYDKLMPYIAINTSKPEWHNKSVSSIPKPNSKVVLLDINEADSSQFVAVKGIGPVLASRIIKYRNKLGGFVKVSQLYEVFGLDTLVVQQNINNFYVAKGFEPKRINLNSADYKTISSHPYCRGNVAGVILKLRKQGSLQEASLVEIFITGKQINKIRPYVEF